MKKGKVKDLILATKDEAVDNFINSEALADVLSTIAELVVSEGTATIIGELLGAITPGVNGVILSYKQRRFERYVLKALETLVKRIDALEMNFSLLGNEMKNKFSGIYLEWLLDNIYEEKQLDKIPYYVNGFINFISDEANDSLVLFFFNTISELTQLDVDVLKLYSSETNENILTLCDKYNLEFEQITVIQEKLARLGLLQNKNDEYRDNNIDYIVDYLLKVDKDSKKSSPQGVKLSKSKINKTKRSETFYITNLGRTYLRAISN